MSDDEFNSFDYSNSDNASDGEMGSENEEFDFDDEETVPLKNDQNSGGLNYPFEVLSQEKIAEDMSVSIKEVNNITQIAPSK